MAAQIGHQEIVTLLLAHGADPTIATKVLYLLTSNIQNQIAGLFPKKK